MKELLDAILTGYGSEMTVLHEDGTQESVRAFLQPVSSKSWQNMQMAVKNLGEIAPGQFVYIGPARPPLSDCDRLLCGSQRYQMRRAEILRLADEELYVWGLAVKDGGDDPWNS